MQTETASMDSKFKTFKLKSIVTILAKMITREFCQGITTMGIGQVRK